MSSHDEYAGPARDVARDWEGSLVCIVTAQPEIGVENDLGIYLDLAGDLWEVRAATAIELQAACSALRATSQTWGDVLAGILDAADALVEGQITIQRGNRDTLQAGLKTFQELLDAPDELSDSLFPMLRDALRSNASDTTGASEPDERPVRYLTVVHDEVDMEFEDARLEALIAVFEHWCGKLQGPVPCGVSRGRDHTIFRIGTPGQDDMFVRLEAIARTLDPGWWRIEHTKP